MSEKFPLPDLVCIFLLATFVCRQWFSALRVQPLSYFECVIHHALLKIQEGLGRGGRLGGSFESVTCCEFIISPVNNLFSSAFLRREIQERWQRRLGIVTMQNDDVFMRYVCNRLTCK